MNQENNFYQNNNEQINNQPQNNQPTNNTGYMQPEVSNQPINSYEPMPTSTPPTKKTNIIPIMIICVVVVAVIIGGVILAPKLFKKGNSNKKASSEQNETASTNNLDTTITGTLGKGVTLEGYDSISKCGNFYYTLKKGDNDIVVDSNGKEVASGTEAYKNPFCFKDGTIFMGDGGVWRNGKKIYTYSTQTDEASLYEDNILYYPVSITSKPNEIVAYDLENQKELWRTEGYSLIGIVGDNIILNNDEKIINKKTGETVAASNGNVKIHSGYEYYVKTAEAENGKRLNSLEVYNFKNELISKNNLTYEDNCYFEGIFTNGYYSINCFDNNKGSHLYNSKSELIKSSEYTSTYGAGNRIVATKRFKQINELDTKDFSILNVDGDYIDYLFLYNDGRILNYKTTTTYRKSTSDPTALLGYDQEKRIFILGKDPDAESNYILYNYETGKSVKTALSGYEGIYGGKYVISKGNNKYEFYDYDLNKLSYNVYEENVTVLPLNNEWIIKYINSNKKTYLVNIKTGEEKELDIKIEGNNYVYLSNANSVVIGALKANSYTIYRLK